ncbi:MAG: Serpin (serine protease inhibitor) [Syntrophaceae bacterium PtaU1.Bin231]|nr:MAG: Serpin (serine protease inhibitor) [Syntrophaceae bacterium PtaU1.Bin231]
MIRKAVFFVFAVLAAFTLTACTFPDPAGSATPDPTATPASSGGSLETLSDAVPLLSEDMKEAQLAFQLELLKALSADPGQEDKNLFFSALSLSAALTMACFGAGGQTREEMRDALGYGSMSDEEVAAAHKAILEAWADSGDSDFTSANSIWIDEGFPVKDGYIRAMNDTFSTQVVNIDLQGDGAVDQVNGWVGEATRGMIDQFLDKAQNPLADVVLVLLNAIYFKGQWTVPFDPKDTREHDFAGTGSARKVDMMSSRRDCMGYEGQDYRAVLLPYGDDERFAMVAVLPEGELDPFIDGLTPESLHALLTTFEEREGATVMIPRFEMEEELTLNDILIAMGMRSAFGGADFSGITDRSIFISQVLHKAKINVNEEGTQAAAASAVFFRESAGFQFIADRPFLFFIVDTQSGLILFTGKACRLG